MQTRLKHWDIHGTGRMATRKHSPKVLLCTIDALSMPYRWHSFVLTLTPNHTLPILHSLHKSDLTPKPAFSYN